MCNGISWILFISLIYHFFCQKNTQTKNNKIDTLSHIVLLRRMYQKLFLFCTGPGHPPGFALQKNNANIYLYHWRWFWSYCTPYCSRSLFWYLQNQVLHIRNLTFHKLLFVLFWWVNILRWVQALYDDCRSSTCSTWWMNEFVIIIIINWGVGQIPNVKGSVF